MGVINLIIADENQNYVMGLEKYLYEEYGQAFETICFTQEKLLLEHLNTRGSADILLISPSILSNSLDITNTKSLILLTEEANDNIENSIYKFQRADKIAKLLLEAYDRDSNNSVQILKSNTRCKLISVYSPSGAAGKSTIAFNLARQYSMQGKKVLLISLEVYTALPIFNQNESIRGLLYLLYLIKSKLPNLSLKLNSIVSSDYNTGIHFIEREKNVLEYKDLNIDDIEILADFLRQQSDFDAVILDLDSSINNVILGAFKHCDSLVNIFCADSSSSSKQEDFKRHICKISSLIGTDLNTKLINVRNKVEKIDEYEDKNVLEIPLIKGNYSNQGLYFPEMTYFKQLHDAVENCL